MPRITLNITKELEQLILIYKEKYNSQSKGAAAAAMIAETAERETGEPVQATRTWGGWEHVNKPDED